MRVVDLQRTNRPPAHWLRRRRRSRAPGICAWASRGRSSRRKSPCRPPGRCTLCVSRRSTERNRQSDSVALSGAPQGHARKRPLRIRRPNDAGKAVARRTQPKTTVTLPRASARIGPSSDTSEEFTRKDGRTLLQRSQTTSDEEPDVRSMAIGESESAPGVERIAMLRFVKQCLYYLVVFRKMEKKGCGA